MVESQSWGAPKAVGIVTGGGRGIGRAVALALGAGGNRVCVNDTGVGLDGRGADAEVAQAVAAEIVASGGRAMASTADARTPAAARELVEAVAKWSGDSPVVLVHCAGTLRDAMVHKASDDDWAEVVGSHLAVAIELTRAMAAEVRSGGYGRFVYVGGAAGLVGSVGQAAYAVAKAGLFGLTRALALEMATRDVCVNYLSPFAYTRMTESIRPVTGQLRRYLEAAQLASAADIAPFIAWLCSSDSAGITGQVFGARGAEISVWSQPRPSATVVDTAGWSPAGLASARAQLEPHLVALESEFDLFGGPPVAVVGRLAP